MPLEPGGIGGGPGGIGAPGFGPEPPLGGSELPPPPAEVPPERPIPSRSTGNAPRTRPGGGPRTRRPRLGRRGKIVVGAAVGADVINAASGGGIVDDIGRLFTAPVQAVQDAVSFLQWVSWLFHPLNWLRLVEMVVGSILFLVGLWSMLRHGGKVGTTSSSMGRTIRHYTKKIPGPVGAAARVEGAVEGTE